MSKVEKTTARCKRAKRRAHQTSQTSLSEQQKREQKRNQTDIRHTIQFHFGIRYLCLEENKKNEKKQQHTIVYTHTQIYRIFFHEASSKKLGDHYIGLKTFDCNKHS